MGRGEGGSLKMAARVSIPREMFCKIYFFNYNQSDLDLDSIICFAHRESAW